MRIEYKIENLCYLLKDYLLFNINCEKEIINLLLDFNKINENEFLDKLKSIKEILLLDIDMFLSSDPAAKSKEEIIYCYPGLFAIMIYRVSNIIANMDNLLLARMLSEYAHSKTGIDIHPKARIGHHFFIDHGTGIVIGETTVIGNYVKIYQGVTLGAISLSKGSLLKDKKRHPTILDNVTIYANASILGADTVIGNNSIIGCNTFITKSVPDDSIIVFN